MSGRPNFRTRAIVGIVLGMLFGLNSLTLAVATETENTVVVPAGVNFTRPQIPFLSASASGIAYVVVSSDLPGPTLYLLKARETTPEVIGTIGNDYTYGYVGPAIAGDVLAISKTDGSGHVTEVELRTVSTGESTTVAVDWPTDRYVGHTGDGSILLEHTTNVVLGSTFLKQLVLRTADGTRTVLRDVGRNLLGLSVDEAGILVVFDAGSASRDVYYLNRATSSWRHVVSGTDVVITPLAPAVLAYRTGVLDYTLHWQPRDGGPTQSLALDYNVLVSYVDGATAAWTGNNSPFYQLTRRPANGGSPAQSLALTLDDHRFAPLPDGRLIVAGHTTVDDFGLHAVTPATGASEVVVGIDSAPALVYGLTVAGGRVLRVHSTTSNNTLTSTPFTRVGDTLSLGTSSDIVSGIKIGASDYFTRVVGFGRRVAVVRSDPTRIAVYEESTLLREQAVADPSDFLGFSGKYVLFADRTQPTNADYTQLLDVATGTKTRVGFYAALTGKYAYSAEFSNTGAITRRDLTTGTSTTVRNADGCAVNSVFAYGDWFGWRCGGGPSAQWKVRHVSGDAPIDVPSAAWDVKLGDGVLVYRACSTGCELRSMDLVGQGHADTLLGEVGNTSPYWSLDDLGGRVVTWRGLDNRVRVKPLLAPGVPAPVDSLSATGKLNGATLSWAMPWDAQATKTMVRVAQSASLPATTSSGTLLYDGPASSFTAGSLLSGKTYSFSVFTNDGAAFSTPVSVTLRGTIMSINGPATPVMYKSTARITGILTDATTGARLHGVPVRVYTRAVGTTSWVHLATRTTNFGLVTYDFTAYRNIQFTLQYWGGTGYIGSSSPLRGVAVASRVTAALSRTSMPLGYAAKISGSVLPTHAGQLVYLQRYVSGSWKTIASIKLSSSSTYAFTVKPTARATYTYRVYKPADGDHAPGMSPSLALKVY